MDTHTHGLIAFNLWLWMWYAWQRLRKYFSTPRAVIVAFILAGFGGRFPDYAMIYAYIKMVEIENLLGTPLQWDLLAIWWVVIPTRIFHAIPMALAILGMLACIKRLRPYLLPLALGWIGGHIGVDYLTHTGNTHRYFWPILNVQFKGLLSRTEPRLFETLPLLSIIEWIVWAVLGPVAFTAVWRWLRTLTFEYPDKKTPGTERYPLEWTRIENHPLSGNEVQ